MKGRWGREADGGGMGERILPVPCLDPRGLGMQSIQRLVLCSLWFAVPR